MKSPMRKLVPILLALLIIVSLVWYCFVYDRDFTRDMLLQQARYQSSKGNPGVASWFYDLAYMYSGQDESVAIELARQYKEDGNYTKAEYTLSNAIADGPSVELYIALCQTYVEKDKLLDAVNMLDNIMDPDIKEEIERLRPAAPVTEPASGFYSRYVSVNLTGTEGTVYYTTDGEYPSTEGSTFTEPFSLGAGETTVYAVCVGENGLVSPRSIFSYTIGGVIEEVSFKDPTIEAAVREMLDRNDPEPLFTNELWNITSFTVPADADSLDDIAKFTYLQTLQIDNRNLDSMEFISSLSALTELTMNEVRFASEDLNRIAALPKLERLTLSSCTLSTIAGLEAAQNLEYLDLSNNTIRNLEPLAYLPKLQEVYLPHNALTGLNALSSLANLEKLDVSFNSLTSISPLVTCSKLSWLDVSNNDVTSLTGLENLQNLSYFAASSNALTDISVLANIPALKELYLASNEIEDITSLSRLSNLEVFDFSANNVEKLPEWSDDAKLRIIDGSQNAIKSLDSLKNQMNLTHIYMDYNQITSIKALVSCYRLVLVNVYGNEIEEVKELTDLDIIVNWDPT